MIRPFKISDRAKLIEIFKLNTPDYFDSKEQKHFEEYLDNYRETYLVVEDDNKVIGGGGYHFNTQKTIGRISWDLFHPDFKGKGLGKQLVNHRFEKIKSVSTVHSVVVWTSQSAFKFYGKFGFGTKEIRKDFWGQGLDLYIMEMKII